MGEYRRRWNGRWWTIYEERDGLLGWFTPVPGEGWEWQTDLRGLRMAEQLSGSAPSLRGAQADFKQAYERWRSPITDAEFDRVYRRSRQQEDEA